MARKHRAAGRPRPTGMTIAIVPGAGAAAAEVWNAQVAHNAEVWEARAAHDVGTMLAAYLVRNPAPPGSDLAGRLHRSVAAFREAGELEIGRLEIRALRAVNASEVVVSTDPPGRSSDEEQ
jgi:hypothetical protein